MTVVLCCGCFDLLHYGHLLHLQAARALGDRLVVAVTADRFVGKGPGRPRFSDAQRAAMLKALRCVDNVIVSQAARPDDIIRTLRPEIYCKGADYKGQPLPERALVESLGGRVVFTETPKWSSTELLEHA